MAQDRLKKIYDNRHVTHVETQIHQVSAEVSVLLQTTEAEICDVEEKCCKRIKILLDSSSQKSYITQRTIEALSLDPVGEEQMIIKTFGNNSENPKKMKMYEVVIKGESGVNLYLKAYSVPTICSSLTGQEVRVAREKFPELIGSALFKENEEIKDKEINLLIGSDYYWTIINNDIRRCDENGLVAISSKLGWIVSGPASRNTTSSVVNCTHVMNVDMEVD